jgi:eukaryotic-like serine/threonine-protein kinase
MSDEATWDALEGIPPDSTVPYTAREPASPGALSPVTARCEHCERDVSDLADSDGRRDELGAAVVYWCPECAAQQRRVGWPEDPAYRFVGYLGSGLHTTWLLWQPATGRVLAGRQIRFWTRREENTQRYIQEAQPLLGLAHPHLTQLLDVHASPAGLLVTSPYVPGENQWNHVTRLGRMTLAHLAVEAARGLLNGLAQLHALGITHANIHPWNVLLPEGTPQRARLCLASRVFSGLLDTFDPELDPPPPSVRNLVAPAFGGLKRLAGLYEQSPAADLYTIGQVLYLFLTGELVLDLPWRSSAAPDIGQWFRILQHGEPVPVRTRRPELPVRLAEVVDRAVGKDPSQRFQTVKDLVAALEAVS